MSWIILAILALITFVIYDLAGRYFATRSENPQVFAAIYNAVVAIMAPILFIFDPTLPNNLSPRVIILTTIGVLLWGLHGRYEYFAKKHTEASIFSITMKLAPVINFFLSLVFLKEAATVPKFIGIGLIVVANLVLYVGNKGKVISLQGLKYTIFLAINIPFAWLLDALNIGYWGVATFSLISFGFGGLISSVFPLIKLSEIKRELALTPIWQIAILGSLNLVGYAFQLKALSLGPVSSVMPIITSTTPFVVLLGLLFLGERNHLWRKVTSAAITFLAVYLMR